MELNVQEIQNCWCKWQKYHPSEGYTIFHLDKVKDHVKCQVHMETEEFHDLICYMLLYASTVKL